MKYLKLFLLVNIFLLASFTASAATYNVKYIEVRNNHPVSFGYIYDRHYLVMGRMHGGLQGQYKGFDSASASRLHHGNYDPDNAINNGPGSIYHDGVGNNVHRGGNRTYLTLSYNTETAIDSLSIWSAVGQQSYSNYDIRFFDKDGKLLLTQLLDMTRGNSNQTLNLSVPVPAAFFLFAPALLGFIGLRRSARKAKLA